MTNTYDTSNEPLGSTAVKVLYNNASNLDDATNSLEDTWVDRLPFGRVRRTWRGMENAFDQFLLESGYVFIGDYDTDGPLTITERNQIFTKDGEYWRAGPDLALPYTTVNNWVVDQPKFVSTGDASLRQALAQPSGAGMVGFRMRTVADRLNDTANVKDYGAIADGGAHPLSERYATLAAAQVVYPHATALTDSIDWAAFQAAINSGAPRVHIPGGHYVLNKGTLCTRDIVYSGDGYSCRIDMSMAGAGGAILTQGDLTQIGNLGANINRGDRTITFAAAPDLVPGDVVIVYNPTDGSWLADRPSYRAGEMWRVHSISGNVVTIYGSSTSTYTSASVQVHRLRGVRCTVENLHFSPSDTFSIAAFKVTFGDTVRVRDIYSSDVTLYTVLEVDRCFDVSVQTASGINRSPSVNDEYGITISNCHNVTVSSGSGAATRHAVAIGGNDVVCCVPNRNVLLYGLILENIDLASDTYSGDMHGNSDNVTYDNCIFRNGVLMSGRNPTIRNSLIYGASSVSGECIFGSECQGGVYTIENCRLVSYGDGFATGLIHITPGNSLVEGLLLTVRNITVEAPNATANTDVVCLRPRNATAQNCNALIDGLQLRSSIARCFLRADDQVLAAMNSGYLIVDNVFGPANTALILASAKITNVPTKQMRQTGFVDIVTTAAQVLPATAQNFRYPYSKIPNAPSPGVYLPNGTAQGLIGSSVPVPKVYEVNTLAIRPAMIATTGTFTAGTTVRLSWETSIDEV